MSQIMNELRRVNPSGERFGRITGPDPEAWAAREFRVLTVTSNKGGVGKTTLATNLAVFVRAMHEDLPVLIVGLDDQTLVDRMFALTPAAGASTVTDALRAGSFGAAARLGEYGIHYVPTSARISELKSEIRDPYQLRRVLLATGWRGLVIIDTKSDLEILTQNAIAASDLALVVVQDRTSLIEAQKVYDLLDDLELPKERARVLLSLVDRRIKFQDGAAGDVLSLLVSEIRRLGYPLFETFISRSPKIESLYTNPEGRALSILHGADGSLVHRQMRHLAHDVYGSLYATEPERRNLPGPRHSVVLEGLTPEAIAALPSNPLEISSFPFNIGRENPGEPNDLAIHDRPPCQVSRRHAALVECGESVGVLDRGSRLGTLLNGQQLRGANGSKGPIGLSERTGILVLGTSRSPLRFAVAVQPPSSALAPEQPSEAARPVTSATRETATTSATCVSTRTPEAPDTPAPGRAKRLPPRPGPFKSLIRRSISRWA